MAEQLVNAGSSFAPDWVSPPGDTILDLMEERGWSQAELAGRLGYSEKHVSLLVNGKVPLTEEAAIRLKSVLGSSVGFWLRREALYRERQAELDARKLHASMVGWLERLPVRDLMKLGYIEKRRVDEKSKPGLVADLLAFFGVASSEQWRQRYERMEVSFRRSRLDQSDAGAISAWLRLGEQLAEKQSLPPYDQEKFRASLAEIRSFTMLDPEDFQPRLTNLLMSSGVTFLLVPAIPRARVSGVARWLNSRRPLIQLSLYGKTNDRFWFSFFHEAAHILLHSGEKLSVFLDDADSANLDSDVEQEANNWAGNFLIPECDAHGLKMLPLNKQAVCDYAVKLGVHPGIVVGRLQHEGLMDRKWMNDLKVSYKLSHRSA